MDELIAFVRQQLDDDERVARAVVAGSWDFTVIPDRSGTTHVLDLGDHDVLAGFDDDDPLRPVEVEHIARWGPARVLAEVDAKRRMLDWLTRVDEYMDRDDMSWHRLGGAIDTDDAVRLLAQPCAGRKGWRAEWTTTEPS